MRFLPLPNTVLACACLSLFAHSIFAEDWPQFRGPNYGTYSASNLPVRWSAEDIVWKTELPGPGSSSPATFGKHIYLTCYTGYGVDRGNPGDPSKLKRHVLCANVSDGQIVWRKTIDARSSKNVYTPWGVALHGYASSTPVVDKSGVYVFLGDAGCIAYSHDGRQRWTFDCGSRNHMFGSGASPVIYNDLIIVNASPESGDLIALNKSSGKQVWRQSGIQKSWNTPAIYKNADGLNELALSIEGSVRAFRPEDGTRLWSCQLIDCYICPSIVEHNGILIACGGKGRKKILAVRPGGSGDVSDTHKLWELPKGSNVGSPVVYKGHIFWAREDGIVYCVNIDSGEIVYEQRLNPKSGLIYASPLLSGGNLYYLSRENGTYVVAAKPKFELVAHNVIKGDKSVFNASPVPYGDGLLLRSDKCLYRIEASQKK